MTETKKTTIIFVLAVCLCFGFIGLGGLLGYRMGVKSCPECPQVASDTVYVGDTASYGTHGDSIPETIVKDSLVPFLVPYPVTHDSIIHDTVYLPMEWKHAHIEDTCDIYYHGVMADIDSMKFYYQNTVITNTILQTERNTPRLTANVGAGAFYCDKQIFPHLYGELSWNAPKTSFSAYGTIDQNGRWSAGGRVTYRIELIK